MFVRYVCCFTCLFALLLWNQSNVSITSFLVSSDGTVWDPVLEKVLSFECGELTAQYLAHGELKKISSSSSEL